MPEKNLLNIFHETESSHSERVMANKKIFIGSIKMSLSASQYYVSAAKESNTWTIPSWWFILSAFLSRDSLPSEWWRYHFRDIIYQHSPRCCVACTVHFLFIRTCKYTYIWKCVNNVHKRFCYMRSEHVLFPCTSSPLRIVRARTGLFELLLILTSEHKYKSYFRTWHSSSSPFRTNGPQLTVISKTVISFFHFILALLFFFLFFLQPAFGLNENIRRTCARSCKWYFSPCGWARIVRIPFIHMIFLSYRRFYELDS